MNLNRFPELVFELKNGSQAIFNGQILDVSTEGNSLIFTTIDSQVIEYQELLKSKPWCTFSYSDYIHHLRIRDKDEDKGKFLRGSIINTPESFHQALLEGRCFIG